MHDIPLNDTQRIFADKNHNLVYKFLHEKNLPASEYYDIVIFGYLRAVQRYLTDPNLAGYSFATVAWRAMEGEVVNTHRTNKRRFRVIRFVRPRQSYTGHLTRRSTPTVTDEEALRESEVALLLHTLAKRVTPQQMEIIRLRTKGYQTNEIAQMQNTSLYHVNTLLDNARFIVVELCRDLFTCQRGQKYASNRGKADGRKDSDSICLRKGIPPGAVQWAEVFQSQPVGNVYG